MLKKLAMGANSRISTVLTGSSFSANLCRIWVNVNSLRFGNLNWMGKSKGNLVAFYKQLVFNKCHARHFNLSAIGCECWSNAANTATLKEFPLNCVGNALDKLGFCYQTWPCNGFQGFWQSLSSFLFSLGTFKTPITKMTFWILRASNMSLLSGEVESKNC